MGMTGDVTYVTFVERALSQMDEIVDSVFQDSCFVRFVLKSGDKSAQHLA